MRIAQVCSATTATYGAVRSMLSLSDQLRSTGHDVRFFTFKGRSFGADVRARGYATTEIGVHAKLDPLGILLMARQLRQQQIDVVHTHLSTSSINGALAAKVARIPSVATVHGLSGRLSFVFADKIIAVAESGRKHLIAQGVSPRKIVTVWNGIDRSDGPWPTKGQARHELGLSGASPILLVTGRVTEMKGAYQALEAVARVCQEFPRVRLVFLGDGDALTNCRDRAQALGISGNVEFAGYHSDIRPYLAAADIFLFPSLKEALPMSIIEAMLEGLPVVCSDAGGIPEIVNGDTGIVVPVGNSAALAEGVLALAVDEQLRESLGNAGRERARTVFSASVMATKTERVYRSLLGQRVELVAAAPSQPDAVKQ